MLACPCALAARDDRWTEIRSAHFDLFTEGGEPAGRDLLHHFEQVRSFFQQAYGLNGRGRVVRIVCFRSPKQFRYYETSKIADAAFHPGSRHDYILMKNDEADQYPMAVHEYTHLILRSTNHDIPVWLDEGLAEVYSNLEPHGAFVVVGRVIPARLEALAEGRWIDLRTLVSATRSSEVYNKQADAEMFYAESWALVHMLALDNTYSPRLKSLMDALMHGGSVEAFQKTYGKPIEQVEADLRAYLDNSRLNAAVFQVRLPQSEPAPKVTPKAGLEARLALAEMLLDYPGRTAEAHAAFDRALHDYPERPEAEQGMGEYLAHERRGPEAATHFARAESLGDHDAAMYLEYGRVLAAADRPDDAITALRKAIALAPALDAAHHELAILLVKTGAFREAVEQFRAVKRLPPVEAPRYYYNLAYAHFKLGEVDRARLLAEKALQVTRNPDERDRVDRLLKEIHGDQ
ncbi:MAG TPA: tetratricopeptide repeat protein [Bryobacteraceae bacterium]|nr:tetratricopeptide repeat protein [Bryobacteraceae bacterium]